MIHMLLVLAAVLLVLWIVFHGIGIGIHLLLLAAIVIGVLWLLGFMRGRSGTTV